jgi:hypothetical protein
MVFFVDAPSTGDLTVYRSTTRRDSVTSSPALKHGLVARDKVSLDITWLRDESLEDMDNLPAPEIIAREIVEDLTAALAEFEAVAAALAANNDPE